jgi:hypothetical protein
MREGNSVLMQAEFLSSYVETWKCTIELKKHLNMVTP